MYLQYLSCQMYGFVVIGRPWVQIIICKRGLLYTIQQVLF